MKVLIVTGTNTSVGKTVATAALFTLISGAGKRVAMVKPVQTGTDTDEPGDAATVSRLSGGIAVELSSLPDPLAPDSAARLRDVDIASIGELAAQASERFAGYDVGLVEGAGGIMVRLDTDGGTLLDLADALIDAGHRVSFVIVTSLTLGTLNHTELTIEAIRRREHDITGLIVGSVPSRLDLAAQRNLLDLPRVARMPVLATIPAGVGALPPADFSNAAAGWFSPAARAYLTGTPTAAD